METRKLQFSEEELELTRKAREYSDLQKQKLIKWFVSVGRPIPSDEDISDILKQRADRRFEKDVQQRKADRERTVVLKSNVCTVPSSIHPLYRDENDGSYQPNPTFGVVAANGMDGRCVLQQRFAQMCWAMLIRNRVSNRLNKALKKQSTAISRELQIEVKNVTISFFSIPNFLPAAESTATYAQAEAPSTTNVELFKAKELKVPFEFKLKNYKQQNFSEHHFANADPEEHLTRLCPGHAEAPEACEEEAAVVQGSAEHFVQPPVTMETYPCAPFVYAKTDPKQYLLGEPPLIEPSTGGFIAQHSALDFGHILTSQNRPLDVVGASVLMGPLPQLLIKGQFEDELSDTDDDEEDLPSTHPRSLEQVMTEWLPPFKSATSKEDAKDDKTPVPLHWDPMPIHSMANRTTNHVTIEQSTAMESWKESIFTALPPANQKAI